VLWIQLHDERAQWRTLLNMVIFRDAHPIHLEALKYQKNTVSRSIFRNAYYSLLTSIRTRRNTAKHDSSCFVQQVKSHCLTASSVQILRKVITVI